MLQVNVMYPSLDPVSEVQITKRKGERSFQKNAVKEKMLAP